MKTQTQQINTEEWRDIPLPEYTGRYEVSNFGNIRSITRTHNPYTGKKIKVKGKILKQQFCKRTGYNLISLHNHNGKRTFSVHRIIARAFVEGYEESKIVNHIDENKINNCASNLQWITYKENRNYGTLSERIIIKQTLTNRSKSKYKNIIQYDKNYKVIAIHLSLRLASKATGIRTGNISNCCLGRCKSVGGYIFRYTPKD